MPARWSRAQALFVRLNVITLAVLVAALLAGACLPPSWGANAILHPQRRPLSVRPDLPYEDVVFESDGITLRGWRFRPAGAPRGVIVYLHGSADNRASGVGLARRFVPRGYEVLAYDGRAHGESGGDVCTYGYYEKRDVGRALDAIGARQAVLFGSSLGAAVALQAAAVEPRIRGVIAQSTFSDLRTIVRERAPWFATQAAIDEAIHLAETTGRFTADDVSPARAAASIRVPVLLLHGSADRETSSSHSRRVYALLSEPKRLLVVDGAGHNDVLARGPVWQVIEEWLDGLR